MKNQFRTSSHPQIFLLFTTLLCLACHVFSPAHSAPANLDPSFDTDGRLFVNVKSESQPLFQEAPAVAIQSDDKIVVVGTSVGFEQFTVARLNSDGSFDTAFRGQGAFSFSMGSTQWGQTLSSAHAVLLQSDRKIIVAGQVRGSNSFAVARLNPDGSFDTSFSGDGKEVVPLPPTPNTATQGQVNAIATQSDGKIVLVGNASTNTRSTIAVVRLNSNGSLDTTFNGDGKLKVAVEASNSFAAGAGVQTGNKIIIGGRFIIEGVNYFAALRLTSSGSFDTSFRGGGKSLIVLGRSNHCKAMALQGDKILLAGSVSTGSVSTGGASDAVVARMNSDGSLDSSFDGDGIRRVALGDSSAANTKNTQSEGKILLTGAGFTGGQSLPVAARLRSDGSLDATFSGDGKAQFPGMLTPLTPRSTGIQGSGKIVLVGYHATLGMSIGRVQANGSVDSSFPLRPFNKPQDSPMNDIASAVAVQNDNKIVVAGATQSSFYNEDSFAVVRLNPDGSLDHSFDGDGRVSFQVSEMGTRSAAHAVALQSDNKIIVAGMASTGFNEAFAVARLNPDGSLDTSFSEDGKLIVVLDENNLNSANAVAVQSDGKIVVSGQANNNNGDRSGIIRLNADGSLDTSFSDDGKLILPSTDFVLFAHAMAVQSDHKIVLSGTALTANQPNNTLGIVRINPDGSFDNSFDADGRLAVNIDNEVTAANALLIQEDQKIVAAGSTQHSSGIGYVALIRVNPDGSLDRSFSEDGKVRLAPGRAHGIALQRDDKIVAAGISEEGGFTIARVNPDGTADPTFDEDGQVAFSVGIGLNRANSVAVQQGDKIVVAGYAVSGEIREDDGDFTLLRLVGGNLPNLAVSNARTFKEGSNTEPSSTTFKLTLSAPDLQPITISYVTADGTAQAGSDYVAKTGTLTFAPGEITKTIRVDFMGDDVAEANETFFLDLRTSAGAKITDSRGKAFIGNDDGPSISIDNAVSVQEGNSGTRAQNFVVKLSASSTNTITVDWATGNGPATGGAGPADFTGATGTLTFASGERSKTITVQMRGDSTVEANEKYFVNLIRPTFAVIADSQGSGFILNDDSAQRLVIPDQPSQ